MSTSICHASYYILLCIRGSCKTGKKRKREKVAAALRVTFEFLRKFSHTQHDSCCCCCGYSHGCCCCWLAENDVTCINNWVLQQQQQHAQENKHRQRQTEMKYGEWQNGGTTAAILSRVEHIKYLYVAIWQSEAAAWSKSQDKMAAKGSRLKPKSKKKKNRKGNEKKSIHKFDSHRSVSSWKKKKVKTGLPHWFMICN